MILAPRMMNHSDAHCLGVEGARLQCLRAEAKIPFSDFEVAGSMTVLFTV